MRNKKGVQISGLSRLPKLPVSMAQRRWTQADTDYLRAHCRDDPEAIAEVLGRTTGGVCCRLVLLGLRRDARYRHRSRYGKGERSIKGPPVSMDEDEQRERRQRKQSEEFIAALSRSMR
jgi:hypothetical protein